MTDRIYEQEQNMNDLERHFTTMYDKFKLMLYDRALKERGSSTPGDLSLQEVIYMEIIEYYSSNNKEYWLSKINECDWIAGKFLYELIKQDKLKELVGDDVKVLLLTNELDLISFCTLSKVDDIPTTELTPWIGFVYTFPEYRGHRHMGKLISYAEEIVRSNGFSNIYISTNQEGIYEKYGFNFMGTMKDMDNEDSRVYTKTL